jgi:hypothetical protein
MLTWRTELRILISRVSVRRNWRQEGDERERQANGSGKGVQGKRAGTVRARGTGKRRRA